MFAPRGANFPPGKAGRYDFILEGLRALLTSPNGFFDNLSRAGLFPGAAPFSSSRLALRLVARTLQAAGALRREDRNRPSGQQTHAIASIRHFKAQAAAPILE